MSSPAATRRGVLTGAAALAAAGYVAPAWAGPDLHGHGHGPRHVRLTILGTTDGIFWAPETSVDRSADATDETPDLTDDPVDPGDSITGFVGFQIPEDLDIAYVMYLPDTTRLIRIYDANAGESGTPSAGDEKNDGDLGPIGKQTPTPGDNGSTDSGDECAGAADWQDVTLETLGTWGDIFRNLDLSNPDAAAARDARDGADDRVQAFSLSTARTST